MIRKRKETHRLLEKLQLFPDGLFRCLFTPISEAAISIRRGHPIAAMFGDDGKDRDAKTADNSVEQRKLAPKRGKNKRRRDDSSDLSNTQHPTIGQASREAISAIYQSQVASMPSSQCMSSFFSILRITSHCLLTITVSPKQTAERGLNNALSLPLAALMPTEFLNSLFYSRFNTNTLEPQLQMMDNSSEANLTSQQPMAIHSSGTRLIQASNPINSIHSNLLTPNSLTALHLLYIQQQQVRDTRNAELLAAAQTAVATRAAMYPNVAVAAAAEPFDRHVESLRALLQYPPSRQLNAPVAQLRIHPNEQAGLPARQIYLPSAGQLGMGGLSQAPSFKSDIQPLQSSQDAGPTPLNQDERQSDDTTAEPTQANGSILYIPKDRHNLNENQIFLRQQLEAFRATPDYICSRVHGKTKRIVLQQVGVRCRHCSHLPVHKRSKASTYFPSNLMAIYQAAQNISVEHLQSGLCPTLPGDVKNRFSCFAPRKLLSSGGGKKYWADAAKKLGLVDTDEGIRFAADVLLPEAAESCKPPPRSHPI